MSADDKSVSNENNAVSGQQKSTGKTGKDVQSDNAADSSQVAATPVAGAVENIDAIEGLHTGAASATGSAPDNKTASKKKSKLPTKGKPPGDKKATAVRVPWLAILVLLVLVLGGGVGYGVYYNYQLLQQVQLTNQAQSANHQTLVGEVAQLRQDLNQTEARNQQLLNQLNTSAEERQAIQQSIDNLSEQLAKKGRGPLQWRLAEVDYLLTIANQRLILQRDVKTAINALGDADARLEKIADPALISVRKAIASELTALKSVQLPDIPGMAVTLQGLTDNIDHLPLINKEHVFNRDQSTEGPVKDWRDLPSALWKNIKSLVSIRRTEQPVERLLPPDEIHYLYQNLGLKLEQARIALLQQDTALFQRNLADTSEWIKRYFDPGATAVSSVMDTIKQLASVDLAPKLPDISASLRDLRQWSAEHQSQVSYTMPAPHRLTAQQSQKQLQKKHPQQHRAESTSAPVILPATSPTTLPITVPPQ